MNTVKALIPPIGIFAWIIITLIFVDYSQDAYSEFQRMKLDIAVNYAVDAAVDEMVAKTQDLHLDYGDFAYLTCDPEVALETFVNVFLENYGMQYSETNRTWVTTKYLTTFVVATYDGYYVAEATKINDTGAYDMVFSLKNPYLYREGDVVYSLNLGWQDCKRFRDGVYNQVDCPITEAECKQVVNNCITDSLITSIGSVLNWSNMATVYVPSEMGDVVRANPIENTTVLAYIGGMDIGFGRSVDSFGIGGARVQHERFVGCYMKNGVKMYQYVDLLDSTYDVIEVFEEPRLAAEKGYEFDISLLLGD